MQGAANRAASCSAAERRRGETPAVRITQAYVVHLEYTRREREILARLILGRSSKQIAAELEITPGAVDRRISSLMLKTGLRKRVLLVLWAEREHESLRLGQILIGTG